MACLDMYNSEHKGHYAPMSPRISFSNDFVDAQQAIRQEIIRSSRETAPVSSDFEFSVTNSSMMSGADELFFKGRLLPFKDNYSNNNQMQKTTTLRDELLVEDDNDHADVSLRPPKGSMKWKGLLGLKRSNHIGSKKAEKSSDGSSLDGRRSGLVHEHAHGSKTSQELLNEGGSSSRDVEIGL
ncbi:uncharacterized protein LOC107424790 [Ziziphus jujuba]|uniref:Uncharacterized protein LOC107424790 n=2 Tax=Ziziphus jujuba TaxID=326968 RepID=A0A6P4A8Q8_ZIZJJ|nr:uncharacterized protein LOC107424790 [Ziziphus jujuba]KAH7520162.1 hypothetical protein FEM48_Zijuj08G0115200 [Ziziphus jujuba var. spinosa]